MTANKPTDTEAASAAPTSNAPEPSQIPGASEDEYGVRGDTPVQPTPAAPPVTAAPTPTPDPVPVAPVPVAPPVQPAPPPVAAAIDERDWDEATRSDYVEFAEPAVVTFLSEKFSKIPGEGGRLSWEFDVLQLINGETLSKILGTRSKRLMRELKKLRPLTNRRVMISRAGEGFATQYTVKVL